MASHPTISNLKSVLTRGGARANLFHVELGTTIGSLASGSHSFWVKAGQVPGSTVAILPVNHGGSVAKIPGLRTFDDWTCTVINDESMHVKKKVLQWMVKLSGDFDGERTASSDIYKTDDLKISQYAVDGKKMQQYTMHNAWPNAIGDTPLDWGTDGLQEFTLTFSYDYWTHTALASSSATSLASLKLEGVSGSVPF